MDEPNDLVRGMLALEVTAVMLVAGELYLVTRPVALAAWSRSVDCALSFFPNPMSVALIKPRSHGLWNFKRR
jgi:hypothetical protein